MKNLSLFSVRVVTLLLPHLVLGHEGGEALGDGEDVDLVPRLRVAQHALLAHPRATRVPLQGSEKGLRLFPQSVERLGN